MELNKKYKHTPIGMIPKDWDVKLLGGLGVVVRGGSPRPAGDPKYFNGNFIPWLTVASLTNISDNQMYVNETKSFLTEIGSKYSRILEEETLIISNSGATLGVAKILNIRSCANDGIAAIINQHTGDKQFVCYYINSLTSYLREVVATGVGQPNLNTTLISKIPIPFPSVPEQRVIASTLSDVDKLIIKLQKLIVKKKNLKKAAIQQLLLRQIRLPGYTDNWEIKKLREIIIRLPKTSRLASTGKDSGAYPFFTNSTKPVQKFLNETDFDTEAIIANTGGEAYFNYYKGKFAAMSDCFVFETKLETKFIYYFLKLVEKKINKIAFSGSGIKHLDKKFFYELKVSYPKNRSEQIEISNVLEEFDNEIVRLQKHLNKINFVKIGIMQELLTGKKRLYEQNSKT